MATTALALLAEYEPLLVLALLVLLGFQANWIRMLRGAVDAQGKALAAQKSAIDGLSTLATTMKAVLESTDEPKMLSRLTSYKQFLEEEMAMHSPVRRECSRSACRRTPRGLGRAPAT